MTAQWLVRPGRDGLTDGERETLAFIREFKREHLYAPTIREIADALGTSSTSVVDYRVRGLREKGLITYVDGQARTIVLAEERAGALQ